MRLMLQRNIRKHDLPNATRSSAVGSAPRSGRGGRAFESPLLDKTAHHLWCAVFFCQNSLTLFANVKIFLCLCRLKACKADTDAKNKMDETTDSHNTNNYKCDSHGTGTFL